MSDKSNKYGYVGVDIPAQSFGNNKGVFNPAEINELVADNKWSTFGQLELIETQTVSGTPNSVDFINLASNPYNVYFLTATNVQLDTDGYQILLRLSNDNGSSFITGSSYQFANMRVGINGTTNEYKSAGTSFIGFETYTGSTSAYSANFYIYFYNLLDSSKFSFTTNQTVNSESSAGGRSAFGSGVLTTAETHNAISLFGASSKLQTSGTYSLYGIAES